MHMNNVERQMMNAAGFSCMGREDIWCYPNKQYQNNGQSDSLRKITQQPMEPHCLRLVNFTILTIIINNRFEYTLH